MADDVQTEPASMTQSTGDILSVVPLVTNHQQHPNPSTSPSPLRKVTSDNHQRGGTWIAGARRSPRTASKSSTGGGASKSTDTAVGVAFSAPATATDTQAVRAVFVDLPSSIGDHFFPRRPGSLPTSRQDDDKADVLGRPSSDQRDSFNLPAAPDAAETTINSDVTSDVDDLSWTTSLSHNNSPAPTATLANTDSIADQPSSSTSSPASALTTGATTTLPTAGQFGDSSEFQLHPVLPELASLSSSISDSVDRPQVSSADPRFIPAAAAASADTGVKVPSMLFGFSH